jgi:hypothetical protein
LAKHIEFKNPAPSKLMEHVLKSPRLDASQCDKWIEMPALLHVSNAVHIYFKFLDLGRDSPMFKNYSYTRFLSCYSPI